MYERNLYQELDLVEYLWGDVFLLRIDDLEIDTEETRIALLDQQCERKGLRLLGKKWKEIDLTNGKALLRKMLTYDLAYSSWQLTPDDKAEYFYQTILTALPGKVLYCYTNWRGNPWNKSEGGGWNRLTQHTFDFGLVLISREAMLFAYSVSED